MLLNTIKKGFPETKAELEQEIHPFWRVKDMLSAYNGVIYMGDRAVVPEELRSSVLDTLHSAHQGTTSMRLRAERNLFWPNMAMDIATNRMSCIPCEETALSQSPEPPMTPTHPEYPFQHICSDFFSLQGHNFCLVVYWFSNCLQVFTGKGGAHNLLSLLGQCFHSFSIPETLTSDGGPEYTAGNTQEFLRKLGVHHRLTSVGFPHANQKAEKSVRSAKRVIRDGELDPIPLMKGLLTLRNTPDQDTGMSPAQMLLGCDLRDLLPTRNKAKSTYDMPHRVERYLARGG
jgi:transposase InsO family protein